MKKQIVHVEPIFKERIWGGNQIKTRFHGITEIDPVGEIWSVAALKEFGDNRLSELNMSLSEVYEQYPDWFGCSSRNFPIRCTFIDPIAWLSVQVHPTDVYAQKTMNTSGKSEAWYIIETKENHKVQFGHSANNREEFAQLAQTGNWDQLLRFVDVNPGDFLNVPAGTIHAIGKDILAFEIAQNTDITFRIYDYDRVDKKTGKTRDLHFEQGLDVLKFPHQESGPIHPDAFEDKGCMITNFIDKAHYFTLYKIETTNQGEFNMSHFYFLSVIEGKGQVNDIQVQPGMTLLIPSQFGPINISGEIIALISSYHD